MVAYHEKQIMDLSEMIIVQGRDIEAMRLEIERLRHKIETMTLDGGGQNPPANEKPPHF